MSRHVKRVSLPTRSHGFTLLELIIALALFSLILSFAYQALVTSVNVHGRVSNSIDSQEERRIAHRTLRDAVGSGGRISGNSRVLEVDLESATTQWSLNAQKVRLQIRNGNELWQFIDNQRIGELLLRGSTNLRFGYRDATNRSYLNWDDDNNPKAVTLAEDLNVETTERQSTNPKWLFLTQ